MRTCAAPKCCDAAAAAAGFLVLRVHRLGLIRTRLKTLGPLGVVAEAAAAAAAAFAADNICVCTRLVTALAWPVFDRRRMRRAPVLSWLPHADAARSGTPSRFMSPVGAAAAAAAAAADVTGIRRRRVQRQTPGHTQVCHIRD